MEALVAVHRASRAVAYAHLGPPEQAAGPHITPEHWREWLGRQDVWVDERDGVVVGFAAVYEARLLTGLYVHPDRQGEGIGDALLAEAVTAGASELWVYEDNPGARRFYERRGWVAEPDTLHSDEDWELVAPALRYRRP